MRISDWSSDVCSSDLVEAGLRALSAGEVDFYVGSILVTGHHIRRAALTGIMVVGEIPFLIEVAMAARSDWPELHSILIKALNAITTQERHAINAHWKIGRASCRERVCQYV